MDVFFQPWVGSQYSSGGIFGNRIMVLGDGHYCGEDCKECGVSHQHECNRFTTNVVKDYLNQNVEREG